MSERELRENLEEMGVPHEDCFSKQDLVQKLHNLLSADLPSGSPGKSGLTDTESDDEDDEFV